MRLTQTKMQLMKKEAYMKKIIPSLCFMYYEENNIQSHLKDVENKHKEQTTIQLNFETQHLILPI